MTPQHVKEPLLLFALLLLVPQLGFSAKAPLAGVGFSGSALMIVYHIGAVEELIKAGAYVPGTTPVAGTSGGSYIATSTTAGARVKHAC